MRDFSMAFPQLAMTFAVFHDYPGLEYVLPKFHDFPGPVVTLVYRSQDRQSFTLALNTTDCK